MSDDSFKDIVAVGLDLKPETLITAYQNGIFPWPIEGQPLLWFCPRKRAVLFCDQLHVPRRLTSFLRNSNWVFTINRCFSEVIQNCAEQRKNETWILPEMIDGYKRLHDLGFAHSIEVWEPKAESDSNLNLIGGLYGVDIGGSFAGESMFFLKSNASKAAVIFLVSILKKLNRTWLDIQVMTPHLEALGAEEISRKRFLKSLEEFSEDQTIQPFEFSRDRTWTFPFG